MARQKPGFQIKKLMHVVAALMLMSIACQKTYVGRPTLQPTEAPTNTINPIPTETVTPPPTATLTPTLTPTATYTPVPTATATFTPTIIPTRLATLFPLKAGGIADVGWSYYYLTQNTKREDGSQLELSAMVTYQLVDRGIHSETVKILGRDVTLYYLRARHTFDADIIEVKLILTGLFGANIPISSLPADGSAYIQVRTQNSDAPFEPWKIHQDWTLPPEQQGSLFMSMLLSDFQKLLIDLPNEVILLADHPVIFPPDNFDQILFDLQRVSASAAKLHPFITIDEFDQLTGPSQLSRVWQNYLINSTDIPTQWQDEMIFAADYLVIITP